MTMRFEAVPRGVLGRRQKAVADRLEGGVMVLGGVPVRRRSRDTAYPYRPDSDLYWLTGLDEPGVIAVLREVDGEADLTVFVPSRDAEAELWDGRRLGPGEAARRSGAGTAFGLEGLDERLPGLLDSGHRIHARLGPGGPVHDAVLAALEQARARGPRRGSGPRGVTDPGQILDELRLRKDAFELGRMREAARITVAGFRALAAELAGAEAGDGVPEWRLEAALEGTFRREGGDGPAYESIVAGGANACVLHYVRNDDTVPADGLVLVDAGSAFGLYAADITRTFPASGRFSPAQRDLYALVEAARSAAVEAVAPGVPVSRIHEVAVGVLTRGLVELGVLEGTVDQLVVEEAYKPFFPHQTSHWLGLDVHDVGDYAVDGEPRHLEPGMVLTVEPGLYFGPAAREAAGSRVEPWAGTGIRIEDDVLVTEEGRENLTAALPTDPDAVEALLRG